MNRFLSIFRRPTMNVIGVIHVEALPGTPKHELPMRDIYDRAVNDAVEYLQAPVDGIIIENMHDIPYVHTSKVGPEIVSTMTALSCKIRELCPHTPVGLQILAGANNQALAAAHAAGLDFIRVEGFIFSHVADEGLMDACAGDLLRYRKQIGAENVQIFTDIKKKHSSHSITSDVDIVETAHGAEFFLSDGLIVTGSATGVAADVTELTSVQASVKLPVFVGSGVTIDNLSSYTSANALIIGSYFKHGGQWINPVDGARVKQFMEKIHELRT